MAEIEQEVSLAHAQQSQGSPDRSGGNQILAEAILAARQGNKDRAYQLSVEATRRQPENADAWLVRSRYARNDSERLFCLSQVNRLNPRHPAGKQESYQMLWKLLETDPFLAYQTETEDYYLVDNDQVASLAVPKDRKPVEPYPPPQPPPLQPAYKLLRLAVVGLLFSGLGTLLFAPLAILSALTISTRHNDRIQATRARAIILISLVLLGFATILAWLFISHLNI